MANQQLKDELETLQLEEARALARDREAKRRHKESRRVAVEAALKRDRENQARLQAGCWHRKGGKGTSQLYMGNDINYAVVTHTLSHGETIVVCQRCAYVWRPPKKLAKKATAEERALHAQQLAEYRRALNFPTDNTPSGTVLFQIERAEEEAAYA